MLQLKHSVFDGPLQLRWMLRDKGSYRKPGGLSHAGLHGIGTIVAGLAGVIMGEVIFGIRNISWVLFSVIGGSIVYRLLI
ncbi:MAG TPA: hypothetical protein PK073_09970, partial [Ignavibacteriaceae bacterium]|nr:hypothetical protein [Ignavibacteriaceae bacterium]